MSFVLRCFALVATLVLAACGGGSLSSEEGHIRLINATAASEFSALDLYAANAIAVSAVPPYSSSGYGDLKRDSYTIDLRQTGTSAVLVSTTTTLAKKEHQAVIAYTSGGTLAMTVFSEEEGRPSNGNGKLRIFNTASADAGAVDVYLFAGACTTLASSAVAPTFSNVTGQLGSYQQLTAAASQHLCVTTAGDRSDLRLDIPDFTLNDQRIVTVVLVRASGGLLMQALVVDQQGAATATLNGLARVRVAASLATPGPVDVDVNDTPIAAGLTSPAVGPYQVVPAGTLTVKVNGAAITPATPITAAPGADLTLLVTGTGSTVTALADDNSVSNSTARPVKLRLVNGLNGATGTATLTVDNALVGAGAAFGTASAYATVPASAGLARVEARSGAVQYFLATNVTLASGRVYSVFLLGNVGDTNPGQLVADR